MEMVALVLLGIVTMAVIEHQRSSMERLVRLRNEARDASSRRRGR